MTKPTTTLRDAFELARWPIIIGLIAIAILIGLGKLV